MRTQAFQTDREINGIQLISVFFLIQVPVPEEKKNNLSQAKWSSLFDRGYSASQIMHQHYHNFVSYFRDSVPL